MALRPELEARVKAVEDDTARYAQRADQVSDDLLDIASKVDSGEIDIRQAIPEEVLDEPSVVRHTTELKAQTRRARRESAQVRRDTTYHLRRQIRR